ncbi:GFA family protein [Acidisphaera sp. S103]|uniref:GFA family protein n=1 Tax=Acidisphaera sp. S103 TaxID=1747223 RepID=UPI00131C1B29|nr:hypothetical protein [Acidisphaera sp. S103]
MTTTSQRLLARCSCGSVEFEAVGAPIANVKCYCNSCQSAGQQFEQLPSAPQTLDTDGGTPYILYRKDRVSCVKGDDRLQDRKLTPNSPTRRVLATCCNSAMFLDFTKGHWLSMYRARLQNDIPPIEMRVMTGEKPAGVILPDDIPNYEGHSGKFMWRLLKARIAMLVGR